jgi:hypothetical protein
VLPPLSPLAVSGSTHGRRIAVTDLAGTQLSNLLETLPGIAKVLRSPVADAIVALVKSASGQGPFNPADVDELLKFAVRRNLMTAEEGDRILLEAKNALLGIMPPPPPPKPKVVAPPVVARPVHHHVSRPVAKPAPRKPVKAAPAKAKATAKKAKPAARAKTARPAHKK